MRYAAMTENACFNSNTVAKIKKKIHFSPKFLG